VADFQHHFIDTKAIRMHAVEAGESPLVVLVAPSTDGAG
jgi:hypothetical protein